MTARSAAGVNVAVEPEQLTVPATAVFPGPARVKVVAGDVSVAQFIASLKVALSAWVIGTPVAPFAATVLATVGGGGGAATVVKLHV